MIVESLAPLPSEIQGAVADPLFDDVRSELSRRLCAMAGCATSCPERFLVALGSTSGFFALPVAQLREWGASDANTERRLIELCYLTHFVYRVEDDVIDAGLVDAVATLKAGLARHMAQSLTIELIGDKALSLNAVQLQAYAQYSRAVRSEIRHRADSELEFSSADILSLGDRAAPLASIVHLICMLSDREALAHNLFQSVLTMCTALQLLDDLQDIERDLQDGNPTWPAKTLRRIYPDVASWPAKKVHGALETLGLRSNALGIAESQLIRAREELALTEARVTMGWADSWLQRVHELR